MSILWKIKSLVDQEFLSVSAEFDDLMNQYNKITHITHSEGNDTPGASGARLQPSIINHH